MFIALNVNVINISEVIYDPGIGSYRKIVSLFDGSQKPFGSQTLLMLSMLLGQGENSQWW